ncbi:sulfotransferase family protein [Flocculibacter collagenilyticus]|uniref:sulfotransferase family protein n=1 Tax=Flocculibacter collagenilyticus TaxID=2744479 RepID=UPI0018F5780A|nr:sulfotransferase family protein [Flocculibacter collagenilyticus]
MISHKDRCIFVHIPKTAGQSIESVFIKRAGLTWQQRSHLLLRPNSDPSLGPPRLAHLTAAEYIELKYISEKKFIDYFKFSFVRNPWARIVSEYRYRRLQAVCQYQHDFKTWLFQYYPKKTDDNYDLSQDLYRHIIPQSNFLYDKSGNCLVDFVGKFETLQSDFSKVCSRLDISNTELPHKNKNTATGIKNRIKLVSKQLFQNLQLTSKDTQCYKAMYDQESKEFVESLYEEDILLFNYTFED